MMNAQDISKMLDAGSGNLQVKNIITTANQTIDVQVNIKFSFLKWLKNIGRDEYGEWNFSKGLGYYEIYGKMAIEANTKLYMFEIAQTNLDKYFFISPMGDFRFRMKVKTAYGQPAFQYKELPNEPEI